MWRVSSCTGVATLRTAIHLLFTYLPPVAAVLTATQAASSLPSNIGEKGSPYSTIERRVPELIPVLGSQPAGDVSHKPGGKLPLLSARPAVTPAFPQPFRGLIPILLLGEQRHDGCEQFA